MTVLRQTIWFIAVALVLGALVAALLLRAPRLAERPMHCDEAVHAVKAGALLETGRYDYDVSDFHGPTIYYFALPVIWLSGARRLADTDEFMFRVVTVAFGVGLVALLLLMADGLGAWPVGVAAVLTAVSPSMVFYSRYYIQEIVLVFFTFGAIACAWRYGRAKRAGWLVAAGVCVGLMQATKETSVLAFAAMAAGLFSVAIMDRRRGGAHLLTGVKAWHAVVAFLAALAAFALFITGFFTNPHGLIDGFLTYASYLKRADGAGLHDHPWDYYLRTLIYTKLAPGPWWSEGLIVGLAVVGMVGAFARNSIRGMNMGLLRFLAVYTLILTVLYALIPYKTPWCMLGFLHGMILLAGVGVVAILEMLKWRPLQALALAALAAGAWQLAGQAERATTRYQADTRNPYVYAHTSSDFMRLAQRFEDVAAIAPEGRRMLIRVMTPDYWPLPWYLRKFERVGYWNEPQADSDAAMVVTSLDLEGEMKGRLKGEYQVEHYGLRPEVLITVFIRRDLWDGFLKQQQTG